MRQILIIFIAILSLFVPLSGNAWAEKDEKPMLYADMAKGEDGRYYITRISTEKDRIDLITLKPLGFDQKRWDCSSMLYGKFAFSDHRDCVPPGSEFRTSVKRPLPTALLGATTLGASVIFGIVIEESVFDEAAYYSAVSEALRNSGLEGRREEIIKRFMSLTEMAEERNDELSEMFRKYRDEYYNSTAPAKVDKQIEDVSGLYTGDLYADMIIRVNRNALTELKPASTGSVVLSGTPEEFEARLTALEGSMHVERTDLETSLRNATKDYPVICGPEHLEPYNIRYECPQRIMGAQEAAPVAKAIIVSKNISGALPELFEAEDDSLKVVFKKGKLYIENRTGEKVSVTGASLKYRNSSTKAMKAAEVPPRSSIDATALYRLITPEIEKAAVFANMTLREAEKTPVDFALSVAYERNNEQKTLRTEKVFRLSDLIRMENSVRNRPAALH